MSEASWIEIAARCALGLLAYLATGVLASAAIARLGEWDSRVNDGLSPDQCRAFSRSLRGPVVLLWPTLVPTFVVCIVVPRLFRKCGRLTAWPVRCVRGLVRACERLSLWAFPDGEERP